MQLSRLEQETIILFNEEEKVAEVETFNKSLQKRLDEFCSEFPDMFQLVREDTEVGAKRYAIPKSNVQIRKPRVISEKERNRLSKMGKKSLRKIHSNK